MTDPFWNPLVRLGILWGMVQLPPFRVIAPPEVAHVWRAGGEHADVVADRVVGVAAVLHGGRRVHGLVVAARAVPELVAVRGGRRGRWHGAVCAGRVGGDGGGDPGLPG